MSEKTKSVPSDLLGPWFFEDPSAVQRLRTAAAEWEHTPFRPFSRAKGRDGGIDCVGLVEELMITAGLAHQGDFDFARTSADYQGHRAELRVLKYLRGEIKDDPQSARLSAMFAEIKLPKSTTNIAADFFLPGDMLILRQEGMMHLPVILDGRKCIHCVRSALGAQISNIHDTTYSNRLDALFRARAIV